MKSIFVCTLIMLFCFPNCKNKALDRNASVVLKKDTAVNEAQVPTLPNLDTTITLTAVNKFGNGNITAREAELFLYRHFKNRGVINREGFKVDRKELQEKTCVNYDTLYKIHSTKFTGAIISYWLGTCDLNGHCFQPSKAVIVKTKNGYNISDENFIPTNFVIDSTVNSFVYGYDYECGRRGIVRQFKIRLR